jgi:hypothetical protein
MDPMGFIYESHGNIINTIDESHGIIINTIGIPLDSQMNPMCYLNPLTYLNPWDYRILNKKVAKEQE